MWKLLNKLFGWDYIAWTNSCDGGIARVYKNNAGNAWYYRYKTTNCIDKISTPNQVIWMTCEPSKYMDKV